MHAYKTGKALQFNGYTADICYTSPPLRCVQSADGILNGMDRKTVPMQLVSQSFFRFPSAYFFNILLGTRIVRMLSQ